MCNCLGPRACRCYTRVPKTSHRMEGNKHVAGNIERHRRLLPYGQLAFQEGRLVEAIVWRFSWQCLLDKGRQSMWVLRE